MNADAQNETPLASCEFASGELRGSTLALFQGRLVHSGTDFIDTLQLDHVGALRIAFERDINRMVWGAVLVLIAIAVVAMYRPLQTQVAGLLGELTTQSQTGTAFLFAALHAIEFAVALMPVLAAAFTLWAGACLAFGWIGGTELVVVVAPVVRVFVSRGKDAALIEFAQSVAAHMGARAGGRR